MEEKVENQEKPKSEKKTTKKRTSKSKINLGKKATKKKSPKLNTNLEPINQETSPIKTNLETKEETKKVKKTIKKISDINIQEKLKSETILLEKEDETLIQKNENSPKKKLKLMFISTSVVFLLIFLFYPFEKSRSKNINTKIVSKAILAQINKKEEWNYTLAEEELEIKKNEPELLTFEENVSYLEAQNFCRNVNQRIPKIKELKKFFKNKDLKKYSLNRLWSNNKNRNNHPYIYDINKKIDLVEDRKNMKHGVICFD